MTSHSKEDVKDLSFYQTIFNEAPIAILYGEKTRISYINPQFLKVFGYEHSEELIGKEAIIIFPERIQKKQRSRGRERALGMEVKKTYETIGIRKDGTEFSIRISFSKIFNHYDSGLLSFIEDLTLLKQIKHEKDSILQQYETIFEKAPLGMLIAKQGKILFCNQNLARMFGYEVDELRDGFAYKIIIENEREKIEKRGFNREAGLKEPEVYNSKGLTKEGAELDIRIEVSPIQILDGIALLVFISDISDRTQIERALIKSEERNRILVESAPEAIVVLDASTGIFQDVNKNAEELFKLNKKKLLSYGPLDLTPKYQPNGKLSASLAEDYIKKALDGQVQIFEWTHINSKGETIPCEITLAQFPSQEETLLRGSIFDITSRKKAEVELQTTREQLFQAQKMETIGRITGGIAHDFNNLLTGIIGYTEILYGQVENDPQIAEQVADINKIAKKAASLTGELLSFSRKRVLKQEIINLNEILRKQLKILRTVARENVEIKTRLSSKILNIKFDRTYLEQVILNIVINARDAMEPKGGTIQIKTFPIRKENIPSLIEFDKHEEFVGISISDEGIGMDQMIIAHIFEPFFSTKGLGKGTGLGLATVHGIVKQNGGYIDVQSEIGSGTTFYIYLPAFDTQADTDEIQEVYDDIQIHKGNAKSILLVDDDIIVLGVVEKILTEAGYTVISTNLPENALSLIRNKDKEFDMLLTDVVMPKMSGQALVQNVLKINPDLPVLFMSGNTSDIYLYDDLQKYGYSIIEKPFTSSSLLREIHQTLSN